MFLCFEDTPDDWDLIKIEKGLLILLFMLETIRQSTAYRSVRYSTVRKNSHTADRSQRFSEFRSKPKNIEESTFYKTHTI